MSKTVLLTQVKQTQLKNKSCYQRCSWISVYNSLWTSSLP